MQDKPEAANATRDPHKDYEVYQALSNNMREQAHKEHQEEGLARLVNSTT